MLWIKAFHVISMVTWFAGLFYLPRLFVYHSAAEDKISIERFLIMERKLYFYIMTPGAVLTLVFGFWLLGSAASGLWLSVKLGLVILLILFHIYCGKLLIDIKNDPKSHSQKFYRWLNEIPTVILIAVVILVVVKPF
ncbi:MAG TPA: protoporphyrinogen oxidase HemJ [Burkholderiales bacterium]|nr:protoporphyrinogen oxidase HemJ [Burkholderiales bacterium]